MRNFVLLAVAMTYVIDVAHAQDATRVHALMKEIVEKKSRCEFVDTECSYMGGSCGAIINTAGIRFIASAGLPKDADVLRAKTDLGEAGCRLETALSHQQETTVAVARPNQRRNAYLEAARAMGIIPDGELMSSLDSEVEKARIKFNEAAADVQAWQVIYRSFGGKLRRDGSPDWEAVRELHSHIDFNTANECVGTSTWEHREDGRGVCVWHGPISR